MKKCELCKVQAQTYCESDQASLCWDCDAQVHGANFLVARHSRTLLCHACQSHTPWKASGPKLGHTVSVCDTCVLRNDEEELEDDGQDSDESNDDEEEEGDNQVVPWSTTPPPPPPTSSSSSEEEEEEEEEESVTVFSSLKLKRMRENASDLPYSLDDLSRSSFPRDATCIDSLRPLKDRRTEPERPVQVHAGSASSSAIIESLRRFCRRDLCETSKESGTVDVDSLGSL
uniref:B box-type domain-containing protein n=1 Tax=Fagus sylvatica TaxID=28930 RepID=A0A2N9F468_FAGSY